MFCSLACRCAKKSQEKSFTYFGLQDYGRCFSGQHAASSYNTHGSSNNCCNQHYKKCDDSAWGECVGKNNNVNYVYEIQEGTYSLQYLHVPQHGWPPHSNVFTYTRVKSMKIFVSNIISEALENSSD